MNKDFISFYLCFNFKYLKRSDYEEKYMAKNFDLKLINNDEFSIYSLCIQRKF